MERFAMENRFDLSSHVGTLATAYPVPVYHRVLQHWLPEARPVPLTEHSFPRFRSAPQAHSCGDKMAAAGSSHVKRTLRDHIVLLPAQVLLIDAEIYFQIRCCHVEQFKVLGVTRSLIASNDGAEADRRTTAPNCCKVAIPPHPGEVGHREWYFRAHAGLSKNGVAPNAGDCFYALSVL